MFTAVGAGQLRFSCSKTAHTGKEAAAPTGTSAMNTLTHTLIHINALSFYSYYHHHLVYIKRYPLIRIMFDRASLYTCMLLRCSRVKLFIVLAGLFGATPVILL